jgi:DNA polymerase-4
VNGIGPKASERLATLGIKTVGDIARADAALLKEHFGLSYATWLTRICHGIDDRGIVTSSVPRSKSRETTFSRDLHPRRGRTELSERFTMLCTRLSEDLARRSLVAGCIGIKVRFADFDMVTRDFPLDAAIADAPGIRRAATECPKRIELRKGIRLLRVKATALIRTEVAKRVAPRTQAQFDF